MSDVEDFDVRVARFAYMNYGKVTEFKNYQGLPMPEWEDLPPKIQLAWRKASIAAATYEPDKETDAAQS